MDPMQFLDILDDHLSEAELGELCRQFGVAYAAFPGASKRDKAREFLGYIRRQGRMAGLAEATVALRPDLTTPVAQLYAAKEGELAWLDQVAAGEGGAMESGLTWRWSGPRETGVEALPDLTADANATESPALPTVAPPNPYTPGRSIADDGMFFGRAPEREQVRRQLLDGEHAGVVSGRGFGSSSLLLSAARAIAGEDGYLTAIIDMKDPAHYTLPDLLDAVWRQWWERVRPGNEAHARTLAEFVTAVRKLNAAGFRPVLFLDELEQLVWRPAAFDDNLFNAWAELGREGLLCFAASSHTPPADLMVQGGFTSRFYKLLSPVHLGLLDEEDARDLLTVPIQAAGLSLPNHAIDDLLAAAGPQPFFLQLAGFYLYDALAKGVYSRGEVAAQFETAAEPYWRELWDALSPLAQSHYPAGRVRDADGMAGRQLRILANKGLVVADESGFRPFSAGFARWVGRMQTAMEAAAVAVRTPNSRPAA